ncbi:hypothetical protein NBRC3299_1851 [Acetobacter pasteurianus NBRC 3299]|uniref:Uncharacterized protein n=1 Tax=Acetobacter ascendens TaxID=481146 RepID=A0A1Y0UYW9_9PROT|nr:hypothetical protein S101447_02022 [Acetobacter ascendens]GCD75559.1 hypothetical protein NBRC3299_1851 [Acetobacter pasteurianus NBRC 3299]
MPLATNPNGRAEEPPKPQGFLPFLFGFAPGGVYRASSVTSGAVRSYRTVSPLPSACPIKSHKDFTKPDPEGGLFSVALSLRLPSPAVSRHRSSVEPGLSSLLPVKEQDSDRPTT